MRSYGFKKGQKVIKVLNIMGVKSATLQVVEAVKKDVITLVDSHSHYDQSGRETDGVLPGCSSEIMPLDGGEEERMAWMLAEDKPNKAKKKK